MKTGFSKLTRFALLLGLAAWAPGPPAVAQEAAVLEIALYPGIRVTGEVGTTYVIESKAEVEGDFWLTRGWIELTTPTALWMDPVPKDSPRKVYRAVKVTKPVVQTIGNMVWISPGSFTMGSPATERGRWEAEGPQTRVALTKGFWLGKYEVTQREYVGVMGYNPSWFQPPDHPEELDAPVDCASWNDVVEYCQKLTEQERAAGRLPTVYAYRLPTEAEWEYACRAGTTTRYSFGDALGCDDECGYCVLFDAYMWWCGNNEPYGPHRVGQKLPNPWGVYDMHGNVAEWCGDWQSDHLAGGSVIDPKGPDEGGIRVYRGGGWFGWLFDFCNARLSRSAFRHGDAPEHRDTYSIGFRIVLAPAQP